MADYVIYQWTADDVFMAIYGIKLSESRINTLLAGEHWEVWDASLLPFTWTEAPSQGGAMGLQVKTKEVFLWVMPDHREKLQKNPSVLLLANGSRAGSTVHFTYIVTADDGVEQDQLVRRARELNKDLICERLKRLKREA